MDANAAFTATLTADSGALDTVTVMMGGEDVTSTAYNDAGTVNITTVTGDIVITATAS